jgi:hypothetical protein
MDCWKMVGLLGMNSSPHSSGPCAYVPEGLAVSETVGYFSEACAGETVLVSAQNESVVHARYFAQPLEQNDDEEERE